MKHRTARSTSSAAILAGWICAGLLQLPLVCAARAGDFWPFSNRETRDPVEQGKIDSADDPAEPVNREIFKGNKFLDDQVLKPVTRTYNENVPADVREGIHNFTNNLGEPLTFVNDLLQGNLNRAWNTTQRFAINTTAGCLGLVDVAATTGRPYHYADLGQTLGVWGIEPGPAVQIPLLGPSNLRDTIAMAASSVAIPFGLHGAVETVVSYEQLGYNGASNFDARAKLLPNTDALEKTSQDYYASVRLIKAQMRAKLVEEGKAGRVSHDDLGVTQSNPR